MTPALKSNNAQTDRALESKELFISRGISQSDMLRICLNSTFLSSLYTLKSLDLHLKADMKLTAG